MVVCTYVVGCLPESKMKRRLNSNVSSALTFWVELCRWCVPTTTRRMCPVEVYVSPTTPLPLMFWCWHVTILMIWYVSSLLCGFPSWWYNSLTKIRLYLVCYLPVNYWKVCCFHWALWPLIETIEFPSLPHENSPVVSTSYIDVTLYGKLWSFITLPSWPTVLSLEAVVAQNLYFLGHK